MEFFSYPLMKTAVADRSGSGGIKSKSDGAMVISLMQEWAEQIARGERPHLRKRFIRSIPVLAAVAILLAALPVRAQDPQQESSSKPPDASAPAPAKKPSKSNK